MTSFLRYTDYLNFIKTYQPRFIANSSSCSSIELSILLTFCLTAIKNHAIKHSETVYERYDKNLFRYIYNSGEIFNKLKSKGFLASSLSTYDFLISLIHCIIMKSMKN